MNNIAIIFAMFSEAKKLIQNLDFIEVNNPIDATIPSRIFKKENDLLTIFIIVSGKCKRYNIDRIGTQAATLLTWEVIKQIKPDLIINAGIAGGFKKNGAQIGDVYYAEKPVLYHHRLINAHASFLQYGFGYYDCVSFENLSEKLSIKPGIVSSGDSLEATETELNTMIKSNVIVKDMEAAAIAEVATLKNIPIGIIKAITDYVDSGLLTQEQIKINFQLSVNNLTKTLELMISYYFENGLLLT